MASDIPTTAGVIESHKPCLLFDLPQELQDMVFAFAYPRVPNLNILVKGSRASHDPFPKLKVDEWLVSRRYIESRLDAGPGLRRR